MLIVERKGDYLKMAKSILISIKPRYVADILNHKKTIEVRKSMPKCDLPIDVYIYCTKDKQRLIDLRDDNFYFGGSERLNGKVVAKFTLNKVEKFDSNSFTDVANKTCILNPHTCETTSPCLSYKEIRDYCKGKFGYAWHISNLVIFGKPKELDEFMAVSKKALPPKNKYILTKAPQSWCYVEEIY